mmetsp:Transcript_11132/g.19467  ORF Transcript_11132/g.19467 Transcript_11132/m.19467 type:complete len:124 (+) Transcript_11132:207-578(+)
MDRKSKGTNGEKGTTKTKSQKSQQPSALPSGRESVTLHFCSQELPRGSSEGSQLHTTLHVADGEEVIGTYGEVDRFDEAGFAAVVLGPLQLLRHEMRAPARRDNAALGRKLAAEEGLVRASQP